MLVDSSNPTAGVTVTGAIRQAAQATGTSFQYLLATAQVESGLNPQAGAATSSARGLFQFIDQTWLATMKQSGPALGYGQYAAAITKTASGHYEVRDPAMRSEILKLRNDPTANAIMAGAFTQANAAVLSERLGPLAQRRRTLHRPFPRRRRRGPPDLVCRRAPQCQRRELFSGCRARQYVDFLRPLDRRAAQPRTGAQYSHRALRCGGAVAAEPAGEYGCASRIAPSAGFATSAVAVRQSRRLLQSHNAYRAHHSHLSRARRRGQSAAASTTVAAAVPDTAGMTSAFAAAAPARVEQENEIFHGLFQDPGRTGPVAAVVSQLWGVSNAPSGANGTPAPSSGMMLDLFKDNERGT